MPQTAEIPAGGFSPWLEGMLRVLDGEGEADVPCGTCTACCRSAYFIYVEPDEQETLARVPRELQFPAPGLPPGHVVLPHDEQGRCPMLSDEGCTIYAHRPRTCRGYDCRAFAAADVRPDRPAIAERAGRWGFAYGAPADRERHEAVRAAAAFLRENAASFPDGAIAEQPVEVALLALEAHALFIAGGIAHEWARHPERVSGIVHAVLALRGRDGAPRA